MKRGKTNGDKGVDVVQQGGALKKEQINQFKPIFVKNITTILDLVTDKNVNEKNEAKRFLNDIAFKLISAIIDSKTKESFETTQISGEKKATEYINKINTVGRIDIWEKAKQFVNNPPRSDEKSSSTPQQQQQQQQQQKAPNPELTKAKAAVDNFNSGRISVYNVLIDINMPQKQTSYIVEIVEAILGAMCPSSEAKTPVAGVSNPPKHGTVSRGGSDTVKGENSDESDTTALPTTKNESIKKRISNIYYTPGATDTVVAMNNKHAYLQAAKRIPVESLENFNPEEIHAIIYLSDDGTKREPRYKLPYLLILDKILSKLNDNKKSPYIIDRFQGDFTGNSLKEVPESELISEVNKIKTDFTNLKASKNNPTLVKHDKNVNDVVGKLSASKFIDTNSIGFLLTKYKFNVKLTEQEENREKQEFTISEFAIKLRTQIKKAEVVDMFESFIIKENDPKAVEKDKLLSDVYQIPNNINLLVMTDFLAYDILSVLLLLLQPRKISKVYIPKSAYNIENFSKLQMGSVVEFITFDNVYELLSQDVNINLVSYLTPNENKRELSHFMMSQKLIKKSPGYFYLDDNKLAKFEKKWDLTNFAKPVTENNENVVKFVKDVYTKVSDSLKEREEIFKDPTKSKSKDYNTSLDTLEKEVAVKVDNVPEILNDFDEFVKYYKFQEILGKDQNKVLVDKIRKNLSEKVEDEFYEEDK